MTDTTKKASIFDKIIKAAKSDTVHQLIPVLLTVVSILKKKK